MPAVEEVLRKKHPPGGEPSWERETDAKSWGSPLMGGDIL
jgi:hypothetical protein